MSAKPQLYGAEWTQEELEILSDMWSRGETVADISRRLGRSVYAIRKLINRRGGEVMSGRSDPIAANCKVGRWYVVLIPRDYLVSSARNRNRDLDVFPMKYEGFVDGHHIFRASSGWFSTLSPIQAIGCCVKEVK